MAPSKRAPSPTRTAKARTAESAATNVPDAVLAAPAINLQRIVQSVDPLGQAGAALQSTLTPLRAAAVTKIYTGFNLVHQSLFNIGTILQQQPLPALLLGLVEQPGGGPAVGVQVELAPASLGATGDPVWALTDGAGHFQLTPPPGLLIPTGGLPLTVQGATARVGVTVPANQVASNGALGVIVLTQTVAPMPQSIIASLANIAGGLSGGGQPAPPPVAAVPTVTLGENNGCQLIYNGQAAIDRFPYGVFFRLVAPQLSIVQTFQWTQIGNFKIPLPLYENQVGISGTSSYADRVPVEQPLAVDGFRDQIMGLDAGGLFGSDETVPMAATLGLGYVLRLAQRWTFQGLALGDLVYSLPLAPGEQQQVAVFERTDTASVFESETLTESQAQQQMALADTSTNATFNSAFDEAASGGSSFSTHSDTSSWGVNFLVAAGGGGSSDSNGVSNSWMQGQRDAAENAAQTTHSAAENQASARRTAARTGMRLATSSESEQVTTKTITNHNHLHALTMQYWEVQRLYDVRTAVEDLDFVCLVPMQIVRFMPPGQPLTVGNPATLTASRQAVLNRYAAIIKHIDVLATALPRAFQKGLTTLRQFAGDPSATVEPFGGAAEDVIQFTLQGTFIPNEDVWINAVTSTGTRVGPAKLAPPAGFALPENQFQSQDDLLAYLRLQRIVPTAFSGALALPPTLDRTQIVGFEITRSFRQIDYTLASPPVQNLQQINGILGGLVAGDWLGDFLAAQGSALSAPPVTVHLTPSKLEQELGGPMIFQFAATIEEFDASGNPIPSGKGETYANDNLFGVTLPPTPYPVPALQLAPMLRYNEILTIEMMAQHVVRNTTRYSKAVWSSLTDEERAILLDEYTIGVPPNGITDASQMIPLLDCVQNKVLGFFGNSIILPFSIPQSVTDAINQQQTNGTAAGQAPAFDPVQIKQSLLAYQQQSFVSPQSIIALPTHGVLGEAVLGHCASGEKLDMTRFWNWQDSPSDTAPTISPVTLPTTTPSIAATLTAPDTLGQLPSLINNVLTAPSPDTSLLQAMGQAAASQKDFDTALTGQTQLASLLTNAQNVSNSARGDALKAATDLQSQAMATVGNIVGGIYGGNPTAGSSAASAVKGGGSGTKGSSGGTGKSTGKSTKGKSNTGNNAKGQSDTSGDAAGDAGDAAGDAGDAGAGDLAGDAGDLLA